MIENGRRLKDLHSRSTARHGHLQHLSAVSQLRQTSNNSHFSCHATESAFSPNMAVRTSTLVAALGGSFVGVHLATGLCRLFLSLGQKVNYLYQFILCGSVTAGLAVVILHCATEQRAVLDSSFPPATGRPLVSEPDDCGERHQPQQPSTDPLASHQEQLLKLFATTEVNESPPSAESHTNLDRILKDIRRGIEETPVLVVDEQPHIAPVHTEQSPSDSQTATNRGKKNKRLKGCRLSSDMNDY